MQDTLFPRPKETEESAKILAKLLADTYLLYLKTQNCHWNVTGAQFYTLHLFFETQYTALSEAVDLIAERIRALGHPAPGSFAEFFKIADIVEEALPQHSEGMICRLLQDHKVIIASLRKGLIHLQDQKDEGTGDLLTQRLIAHENMAWMLASHMPCP